MDPDLSASTRRGRPLRKKLQRHLQKPRRSEDFTFWGNLSQSKETIMKKQFALLFAVLLSLSVAVPVFAVDKKAPAAKPEAAKALPVEKKAEAAPVAKAEPVDINTATEDQPKAIPGIGDTYAKKIIAGRPFAKKDQL